MLPDEENEFEAVYQKLLRRHPHLPTKALVDLVNGIDVTRDHLRVAEQTDSNFLKRLLAGITGETQARMTRVSVMLAENLEVTNERLNDIEIGLEESDLAVGIVASYLHTLERRLDSANIELREEMREALHLTTTRLERKYEALEGRVHIVELRDAAEMHRDLIFARWSDSNCYKYPPIAVALSIASELWWGDFGSYIRAEKDVTKRSDFLERAQFPMAELVARAGDTTTKRLLPRDAVLARLEEVSTPERKVMKLIASPNVVARTPLLNLIADQTQSVEALPTLFSPSGLTKFVLLEMRRATEFV